jgi:hypothetical protein
MEKNFQKILILVIGIFAILSAGSCQPETPSEKMSRLIAVENSRLKKELELRNRQIEKLTKQHSEENKKHEQLLADCLKEKDDWRKKAQQNVRNQVKGVFDAIMEKNAQLLEENEKLKAQIEKIQN